MGFKCLYCNQQHVCNEKKGFPNCLEINQFDNTTKKFKKEYLKGCKGTSQLSDEELKELCINTYIDRRKDEMFYGGYHHISILKKYSNFVKEKNVIKIQVPIEYNVKLYKLIDQYYGKDKTKQWDFQYLPKINMGIDIVLDEDYIKSIRLYDTSIERSFGFRKLDRKETFSFTIAKIIEVLNKIK